MTNEMKCSKCKRDFEEKYLDESHDVPIYMFDGQSRSERKNQADKWGRHYLCKKCHDIYERKVFVEMIRNLSVVERDKLKIIAKNFAVKYFGESNG